MFGRKSVMAYAPQRVLSEVESNKLYSDREMRAFDSLTPELRERVSSSAFGPSIADLVEDARRRQPSRRALQAIIKSGRLPCDLTGEEFLLVEIELIEADERRRLGVG